MMSPVDPPKAQMVSCLMHFDVRNTTDGYRNLWIGNKVERFLWQRGLLGLRNSGVPEWYIAQVYRKVLGILGDAEPISMYLMEIHPESTGPTPSQNQRLQRQERVSGSRQTGRGDATGKKTSPAPVPAGRPQQAQSSPGGLQQVGFPASSRVSQMRSLAGPATANDLKTQTPQTPASKGSQQARSATPTGLRHAKSSTPIGPQQARSSASAGSPQVQFPASSAPTGSQQARPSASARPPQIHSSASLVPAGLQQVRSLATGAPVGPQKVRSLAGPATANLPKTRPSQTPTSRYPQQARSLGAPVPAGAQGARLPAAPASSNPLKSRPSQSPASLGPRQARPPVQASKRPPAVASPEANGPRVVFITKNGKRRRSNAVLPSDFERRLKRRC